MVQGAAWQANTRGKTMSSKSKKPGTTTTTPKATTPKANWLDTNHVKPDFGLAPKIDKQQGAMAIVLLCQAMAINALGIDILALWATISAGYANGKQAVTNDGKSANRIYIVHGMARKPWCAMAIAKLAVGNGKGIIALKAMLPGFCKIAKQSPADVRAKVSALAAKGNKDMVALSVALKCVDKVA